MRLKRREKKPFRSQAEEFIKQTNPRMVFAHKPGFDFMVARRHAPGYIKFELTKTRKYRGGEVIYFVITYGQWQKMIAKRGFAPDFFVVVGENKIYYGFARKVSDYLQETMREHTRQKSFRKTIEIRIGPKHLVRLGIMKAISRSEAHRLEEELIKSEKEGQKK